MKTITNLTGQPGETHWTERRGLVSVVSDMPAPGVIRTVSLGAAGLVFKRADKSIAIPLADLLQLADEHCDGFAVSTPSPAEEGRDEGGLASTSIASEIP